MRNQQREAQLKLQRLETDLLRVNSVMVSKHKCHADQLEIVKLHIALGETEEAKKQLSLAKESFPEIAALEAEALKLDGSISVQQADVEERNNATAVAARTLSNKTVASAQYSVQSTGANKWSLIYSYGVTCY